MGCGSSRVENSRFCQTYGEPSEFDTCSSVVSTARDNRGEPDGREVVNSPVPKEVLNDYSNRISNFAPKDRSGSFSSRRSAPRTAGSTLKMLKPNSRVKSDFNELTEPVQDEDAGSNVRSRGPGSRTGRAESPVGETGDFLTAR
ncbi:uncharacterized protein LOC117298559 [Asterias rubens]|uniref:uncharacterized protein LOC117298559 n=1 Tax=Asterias rubens TaxID=7604 RepID=UPI001455CD6C|nr:uncharacterized protein LOC117298559 [Asterias rubens]